MTGIENGFVSPPSGFFPYFGSVYSGGGFTLGAGYRQFYAREAVWEVKGLYSIKNYKLIEVGTRAPWNNNGRLTKGIRAGVEGRTSGRLLRDRHGRGQGRPRQLPHQADVPRRRPRIPPDVVDASRRRRCPYEDIRNEEGDGLSPVHRDRARRHDRDGTLRAPEVHPQRGHRGDRLARLARATRAPAASTASRFADYSDRDKTYSFQRLDGEVIQHLPILRETGCSRSAAACSRSSTMTTTCRTISCPSSGAGGRCAGTRRRASAIATRC